jgi:hypothetical protein
MRGLIWWKLAVPLLLVVFVSIGLVWAFALRPTESARPPLDAIQDTLDQDFAKGRFAGRIGEFVVYSRMGEAPEGLANRCLPPKTERVVIGAQELRGHELWADVFGEGAVGVYCDDQLVIVNSGPDPVAELGGAESVVKMYFDALPAPVLLDAPPDRIELIQIDGYQAVIEHPVEGYPYATASLAVIERLPSLRDPGIIAFVNFASSSQVAIDLAKRLLP